MGQKEIRNKGQTFYKCGGKKVNLHFQEAANPKQEEYKEYHTLGTP